MALYIPDGHLAKYSSTSLPISRAFSGGGTRPSASCSLSGASILMSRSHFITSAFVKSASPCAVDKIFIGRGVRLSWVRLGSGLYVDKEMKIKINDI